MDIGQEFGIYLGSCENKIRKNALKQELWTSDHNQARFVSASARASAPDEHRGPGFSRQPSCSRSFGSRSDIVRYPEGKARAEGKDDAIREGKERSLVFLEVKED